MQFTHIANPVRVHADRIVGISESGSYGLESGQWFTPDEGMLARYTPKLGDYLVTQEDGYLYFNPKDVFERKYSEIQEKQ